MCKILLVWQFQNAICRSVTRAVPKSAGIFGVIYDITKNAPKATAPEPSRSHSALICEPAWPLPLYIFSFLLQFTSLLLLEGICMYLFNTIKNQQHLDLYWEIYALIQYATADCFDTDSDIWKCHNPNVCKHCDINKLWPRWSLNKYCVTYINMYIVFGS